MSRPSLDWVEAFRGIPHGHQDLADNLRTRSGVRQNYGGIILAPAQLREIAFRIDSLSRQLTAALGGDADRPLDDTELEAYERQQAEAEAARAGEAIRTGTLVHDAAEPSDWSALYDSSGRLVEQGHGSNIRDKVLKESWAVNVVDAEGVLFDWGAGTEPGLNDWQEFPHTLAAVTGRIAVNARKARQAEHVAALDAEEAEIGDV